MKDKSVIYVRRGSVPDIEGLGLSTGRPVCEVHGHPSECILDTEPVSLRDRFAVSIAGGLAADADLDVERLAAKTWELVDEVLKERKEGSHE